MLIVILFLIFCTIGLVGYSLVPAVYDRLNVFQEKRQQKFTVNMEQLVSRKDARKMSRWFVFSPFVFSAGFFFLFPEEIRLVGVAFGFVGGIIFPGIYIKALSKKTKEKFNDQLVDGMMIMSSSFRGGLSLVQAIEAVVEEMPDPISREFGIVLGENKMGVSLEESLSHLYNRMPLTAVQQMTTAILLARETGGNLPVIFTRIVTTLRENKKIQQNLDTLTMQGKIQGVVMSLLPIGFAFIVYSSNRQIFDHMLKSDMGRAMLIYAMISEVIGAIMIIRISSFRDF